MAKRPVHKFNSPISTAKFPSLTQADYGTTEYPCPQGRFKTKQTMRLDDPAVQAFIAKLKPLHDEAVKNGEKEFAKLKVETRKKLKNLTVNELYTVLYDKETEEPNGYIDFNFKADASGVANKGKDNERKWTFRPQIFDAKGKELRGKDIPEIWGGSELKVAFEANPYFIPGTGTCGVSLKLKAVQIIELRSGGERSASDFGFGAEDGYVHQTDAEAAGFDDESGEGYESENPGAGLDEGNEEF